jgi:enoyl-[acyl-carrier-protein] reductase (NADH)
MIKTLEERAVLKQATDLGDCADMFVCIAKNTSMTGEFIKVDSGLNVASL